jgi:sugar phosphate isomerase/epimerase
MELNSNLTRLIGTLSVDSDDLDELRRQTEEMKQMGYYGVYFNNVFFTIENTDFVCAEEDILFREDNCLIIRRKEDEIKQIKQILDDSELVMPSAHFLHMLPQLGEPIESIFSTHEKILDIAQALGLDRITTHIGGIAVPTVEKFVKRPTPLEKFESKEIDQIQYLELLKQAYGKEKIISDSLIAYKHLCKEAVIRGITVTIETACLELLELNTKPEAMLDFINQVGADNMAICVDSGHCHLQHLNVADVIRKCGSAFIETHFHDNFAINDNHNPVGIGTINWYEVITAMHETGYKGEITFEQEDYVSNYRNWMLFVERVEKCAY